MTYLESAESIMVTRARAFREFKDHGMPFSDFDDFLKDVMRDHRTSLDSEGNVDTLPAEAVLLWLGY